MFSEAGLLLFVLNFGFHLRLVQVIINRRLVLKRSIYRQVVPSEVSAVVEIKVLRSIQQLFSMPYFFKQKVVLVFERLLLALHLFNGF